MVKSGTIRVLIVEDHPLYTRGLSSLIGKMSGYSVAGEASNIADALKIAERERPHLVTVDINLGEDNGMNLITQLKALFPETVILVISQYDERYYSERILRQGARGYIMKTAVTAKVQEAIKTVMGGKIYLSENERDRIFEAVTGDTIKGMGDWAMSLRKLSDREIQVFALIGKGFGTIEIATKFNISTKTIDTHKEHIKLKLHCANSQELRQMAIEWVNNSRPYQ